MKQILTILLILIASSANAQQHFSRGNATSIDSNKGTAVARYTMLQRDTAKSTVWTTNGGAANVGGKLYLYDGSKWASPTSGVSEAVLIDTSNAIHAWAWATFSTGGGAVDSYLYATRAWRQKGIDSVNGTVATRVKYTDTAAMLLPYQRTVNATSGTVTSVATGYGVSGGTITTSGTISADTAAIATRSRVQKAVDSLNVLIAAKGTGTVTSVATNTGTGITGGTITGSGTIAADTTVLGTRAWRDKLKDSLNIQDGLRVKYTDTASMLLPYQRTVNATSGTVTNVIGGTNISITGTSTVQPTVNITGTIAVANGGTGTTATTSVNTTPITYGTNNTVTASAATLTTTTLNPTVVTSSLTSVGTITSGTWSSTIGSAATGSTQTINNNSTQIATTAYADRYHPVDTTISAAYTLTSRDFYRTIHCTNASNIALTIPSGLGTTFTCVVLAEGAGTVTPTTSSTTFYYQPTSTTKIKSQGGATIRSWATANSYLIIGSLE